jgi:hypothetical protein
MAGTGACGRSGGRCDVRGQWCTTSGSADAWLGLCWHREDVRTSWVKQAVQSVGAGPLRWVVVERAGGLERARIRSGPRVGKERERKRKMESGPTELRIGISAQEKGMGNKKSFYYRILF